MSGRRGRPALLVLAALVLLGAPARRAGGAEAAAGADPLPAGPSLANLARVRLGRHVNAAALTAWRDSARTPDEARAFDFLFAWLPSADLGAWHADAVIRDIRLALATRAAAPWRDQVDDEMFLRFVLPHRVAQEPVSAWRPELHALLWDRVRGLPLPEAILEVNRFCREWATFQPSSARDQGPLSTMARGLGRCEEEMIFFVCAARSVGIPARPCYTPWWTASDDNHAWVEAWAGDRWHYLGACEPEPALDRAWFTGPARRTGLVLSVAYGEGIPASGAATATGAPTGTPAASPAALAGPAPIEVYSRGRGVTLVNSTGVYTAAGRVTARWLDLDPTAPGADTTAERRRKLPVTVHVFNSGSLVPLGSFASGDTMSLGPQDYFASASVDGRAAGAFFTVRPGEVTAVPLDPRGGEAAFEALFARPFALRIPEPPAAAAAVAVAVATGAPPTAGALLGSACTPRETPADSLRRVSLSRIAILEHAAALRADSLRRVELAAAWRQRDPGGADAMIRHLDQVPTRTSRWISFLLRAPAGERDRRRALVLEMDDKDLLEADTISASVAVTSSESVRSRRRRQRTELPDSLWDRFVLSPRIDDQPYDPEFWTTLPTIGPRDHELGDARFLHEAFTGHVNRDEPTRLGHLARPSETWRSGYATPAAARVGLVGLLRRNGIPARVEAEKRWVEAYVDGRWVPCDPLDAASWDRRQGDVAVATGTRGHVRAVIRDGDSVMTRAEPWRHFRLVRFTDGRFAPYDGDYPTSRGVLESDLEPGAWWLFGGLRATDGSPQGTAVPFRLAAGESLDLELNLSPNAAPSVYPQLPAILRARAGTEGPVLLFAWKRHSEPSLRTAAALAPAIPDLGARGVALVSMPVLYNLPGVSALPPPAPGFPEHTTVIATPADLAELFGDAADSELPIVCLADRDGSVLLRLTGMRPDAADRVREMLARLDDRGRVKQP